MAAKTLFVGAIAALITVVGCTKTVKIDGSNGRDVLPQTKFETGRYLPSGELMAESNVSIMPLRPQDFRSGLSIPAGETFNLGGGQDGSYIARIVNVDRVPVEIMTDATTVLVTIEPGEQLQYEFEPKTRALFRNNSASTVARLDVRIWGDTDLSMEYYPNDQIPQ